MTRLPLIHFRKLAQLANAKGWIEIRCVGSHHVFRNKQGNTIVIPNHGSQVIVRPLLRKILRDMEVTVQEYIDWLKNEKYGS